ncbi:hypothetical protein AB0G85_33095 [Streptomyces sioyaensis]|uniref:hypothetical protein n=1 Tax=Streptomyces sioyaensis TaxID=67364 RepID=UPI0033DE8025
MTHPTTRPLPPLRATAPPLALFGTLIGVFAETHSLLDHWVNAAKPVSTFVGVSLLEAVTCAALMTER